MMIIKTKKMSAREVKKKLHDFIDGISEDCGPEIEDMAEELKAHGDEFVDALSGGGEGAEYRDGGFYRNYRDGGDGGGVGSGTGDGASYRRSRRSWHRNGYGASYRENEDWQQKEEARKKNEQKLQEMERQLQELRQQMESNM